jgi:glycine dehydrogenase
VGLPSFPLSELKAYYSKLGELNVSPDTGCFPLGSCTMKYNPHINDWAAGLPGFTGLHRRRPPRTRRASLELLWQIQEWLRKITGLAGLTTQPGRRRPGRTRRPRRSSRPTTATTASTATSS